MLNKFKHLWTATVARQLILGIALVHAILMSIFVFDLVSRQREFMIEQNTSQAVGLAETLSANGTSWILANDIVGIEEVIRSQSRFPGLDYAMFLDMKGKVLGYTDRGKVGMFIDDIVSQKLLSSPSKTTILIENPNFVDVASPVMMSERQIGWARVGINRQEIIQSLDIVTNKGFIYTLTAILVGVIFASLMARGLTVAIRKLTNALQQIIAGKRDVQCVINRNDEMGTLSQDFNLMLLSIKEQEQKVKKANDALIESEVKFRRLFDALSSEYFLFSRNVEGIYTYATDSVTSVLGYGVDEFKIHCNDFLTNHPDNSIAREHTQKTIEGVLQPSYEIEVFHRNGDKLWLSISEVPVFDEQENVIAVEGIAHDISQRKNFESILFAKKKEQSEILDTIHDGVIELDERGIILNCNKAAEKLFGYQCSDLQGKSFAMLFSASDLYSLIPDNQPENDHKKDVFELIGIRRTDSNDVFVDVEAENKNGTVLPVRLTLAQLTQGNHVEPRYICSCFDLTEQQNHEERLKRSQKVDVVGKLTGGIAHDFNNMLGVIIGYSDLLLMTAKQQPKILKYVEEIRHAGERGKKLTEKLLSFSRRQEIGSESVELNELLKDNHHMLAKSLTSKIDIKYKLDDDLWPVWLDKGDMEDALVNLSINAMQAMPDGGQLKINTKNVEISPEQGELQNLKPGEYVYLSITDTGIGMNDKTRQQVFDPFFTTKEDMGVGLGLSQVYTLVRGTGGTINVYSELGRGTSFSLFFPRYKAKTQESETININPEDKEIPSENLKGHGELILLVDDEVSLLSLFDQILTQNGYNVLKAENAYEALHLLEKNNLDSKESNKVTLIISDVIMPGMDGYQLSTIVNKLYPEIKIQLSTGFVDDQELGYQDNLLNENLLTKPFSSDELLLRIKKLLK